LAVSAHHQVAGVGEPDGAQQEAGGAADWPVAAEHHNAEHVADDAAESGAFPFSILRDAIIGRKLWKKDYTRSKTVTETLLCSNEFTYTVRQRWARCQGCRIRRGSWRRRRWRRACIAWRQNATNSAAATATNRKRKRRTLKLWWAKSRGLYATTSSFPRATNSPPTVCRISLLLCPLILLLQRCYCCRRRCCSWEL